MEWFSFLEDGELIFRIIVAAVIGCIIGYERHNRDKNAGFRTHSIVCMGAALMMIISKYSFSDVANYDAARVAAQIVSGVGFLGAGTIFIKKNSVSGLTTSAGIWATAGVGMAIGAGSYLVGIGSGFLLILVQIILHNPKYLASEPFRAVVKITVQDSTTILEELRQIFEKENIRELYLKVNKNKDSEFTKIELTLMFPSDSERKDLINMLMQDERVSDISG